MHYNAAVLTPGKLQLSTGFVWGQKHACYLLIRRIKLKGMLTVTSEDVC